MNKFVVQQKSLGLSECERLCGTSSAETERLAYQGGWQGLPGEPIRVPVGTAINMIVLSVGRSNGLELNTMGQWLPGLRNETLFRLAVDTDNWSFEGASQEQRDFWAILYGDSSTVRHRVGPLIGCYSDIATRQLRVHSQRDVERLSNLEVEQGLNSGRPPRFTIDAHDIARRVMEIGNAPFFYAKAKVN